MFILSLLKKISKYNRKIVNWICIIIAYKTSLVSSTYDIPADLKPCCRWCRYVVCLRCQSECWVTADDHDVRWLGICIITWFWCCGTLAWHEHVDLKNINIAKIRWRTLTGKSDKKGVFCCVNSNPDIILCQSVKTYNCEGFVGVFISIQFILLFKIALFGVNIQCVSL